MSIKIPIYINFESLLLLKAIFSLYPNIGSKDNISLIATNWSVRVQSNNQSFFVSKDFL